VVRLQQAKSRGTTEVESVKNMVLRKVFGHKWKEVRGGHRILDNEELHDLCFSQERLA
jgi:hypothetical protein